MGFLLHQVSKKDQVKEAPHTTVAVQTLFSTSQVKIAFEMRAVCDL